MTLLAAHSNAYNHISFLSSGVDSRTGQYTLGIELMALVGNYLIGPNLPLRLAFDALTPEDTGFGKGWTLNLTRYIPSTSSLQTHTGEQFHVDGGGAEPKISEQKLKSFRFLDKGNGEYRVVHRTGMEEQLKVIRSGGIDIAVPHRVYAPSGRWIELSHEGRFGEHRCLSRIVDASGLELLSVTYSNNLITYHLHPDFGETRYQVELKDRWVERVTLPSHDDGSWRLFYENSASTQNMTCLRRVETPLGGIETITYDDAGHQLLTGAPVARIPRVKTHTVDPGANQPALTTTYSYPKGRNFLGFGSGLNWEKDKDNLYRAGSDFTYEVELSEASEGTELRKSSYRYNRHHLLILQTTAQYGDVIDDVTEDACKQDWHIQETETVYHENPNVSFEYQQNNFQLPKTVTQRWRLKSDSTRLREEVTITEYDPDHGNLIREEQPNGIVTTYAYYDKDGEDGCPPDPQGFQRSVKSTTTTPSKKPGLESTAPVLIERYTYTPYDALPDATRPHGVTDQWLVLTQQTLHEQTSEGERLLHSTAKDIYKDKESPYLYGRQAYEAQTFYPTDAPAGTLRNLLKQATTRTDWTYLARDESKPYADYGITEKIKGFDGSERKQTHYLSPVSGAHTLAEDLHGTQTQYLHDDLNRPTRVTVAPTGNKAERSYSYHLAAAAGARVTQTTTDAKDVVIRTVFNGANQVVEQWREISDPQNPALRLSEMQTYLAKYNGLGQLVEETSFDHGEGFEGGQLSMTTLYSYGPWGELTKTTYPDKTCLHSAYLPLSKVDDEERFLYDYTATWQTNPDIRLEGALGSTVIDPALGLFSLNDSTPAQGIAIQLLRSDNSPMTLELDEPVTWLTIGNTRLDFKARYYQIDPKVSAGDASGALNFTISYR